MVSKTDNTGHPYFSFLVTFSRRRRESPGTDGGGGTAENGPRRATMAFWAAVARAGLSGTSIFPIR